MSVTLHTSLGDIKFELFCDGAPKTCKNFLALAASNYYDNSSFHRNMKKFMIQGGDPTGTGKVRRICTCVCTSNQRVGSYFVLCLTVVRWFGVVPFLISRAVNQFTVNILRTN